MIGNIKGIIDKGASRKLGETVVAGAAAPTGAVEARWPIAGDSDGVYRRADVGGYLWRSRLGSVVRLRVRPVISICFDLDVPKDSALPLLPDSVKALMAAPCGVTRSHVC